MYTMNAIEFNEKIMKGHFKKIYPVIARQIVQVTGITKGLCIDLGGGPGMLGISLAKITELKVIVYDLLEDCVKLVPLNSKENKVENRVNAIQGRAEDMTFPTNSVDLVVSRGSIFFWEDQQKGISEVYRILKPGGWAYIGGGFGTVGLMQEIDEMKQDEPEWIEKRKKRLGQNSSNHLKIILENLGIPGKVDTSEAGTWIIFQKSLSS